MKIFISLQNKIKALVTRDYVRWTLVLLFIMLGIYCYVMFAPLSTAPKFTYAEF